MFFLSPSLSTSPFPSLLPCAGREEPVKEKGGLYALGAGTRRREKRKWKGRGVAGRRRKLRSVALLFLSLLQPLLGVAWSAQWSLLPPWPVLLPTLARRRPYKDSKMQRNTPAVLPRSAGISRHQKARCCVSTPPAAIHASGDRGRPRVYGPPPCSRVAPLASTPWPRPPHCRLMMRLRRS